MNMEPKQVAINILLATCISSMSLKANIQPFTRPMN